MHAGWLFDHVVAMPTLQLLRPLDNCPIYNQLQDSDMHNMPDYIAMEEKYKVCTDHVIIFLVKLKFNTANIKKKEDFFLS